MNKFYFGNNISLKLLPTAKNPICFQYKKRRGITPLRYCNYVIKLNFYSIYNTLVKQYTDY
ncbi:hypothetical protein BCD95_000413 [Clostridium beijerinckii]|uniref:Uncharacterized protein n=1 Tax=Clostridium beijerinckii TaxID=1520 RepID=A0AAE5H198_CLOBE|nr:hypothetical protein [Clostridium beijerinckii]OOM23045.1 hypothetical protein CLOBE_42060 [Clostridium beijerinckii]